MKKRKANLDLRGAVAGFSGLAVPLRGFVQVLGHTASFTIKRREAHLRFWLAAIGCLTIPLERVGIVRFAAVTALVNDGKIQLGLGILLVSSASEPFHGFSIVLLNAFPLGIHRSDNNLGVDNTLV